MEKLLLDSSGNKLIINQNTIYLQLASEKRQRKVGFIENKMLHVERSRAKHLHIKMNGLGFNHHIIKNATRFDKVSLNLDGQIFIIPNLYILENGKFLLFKEQGFELQIFLTLEQIQKASGKVIQEVNPEKEEEYVLKQDVGHNEKMLINNCIAGIKLYLKEGETIESTLAQFENNPIAAIKYLREREHRIIFK